MHEFLFAQDAHPELFDARRVLFGGNGVSPAGPKGPVGGGPNGPKGPKEPPSSPPATENRAGSRGDADRGASEVDSDQGAGKRRRGDSGRGQADDGAAGVAGRDKNAKPKPTPAQVVRQSTSDGALTNKERTKIARTENGQTILENQHETGIKKLASRVSVNALSEGRSNDLNPVFNEEAYDKYAAALHRLEAGTPLTELQSELASARKYLKQNPEHAAGIQENITELEEELGLVRDAQQVVADAARTKRALIGNVQAQIEGLEPEAKRDAAAADRIQDRLRDDVEYFIANGGELPSDGGALDDADWHPVDSVEEFWEQVDEVRTTNERGNILDQLHDAAGEDGGQGDAAPAAAVIQDQLDEYYELRDSVDSVDERRADLTRELETLSISYTEDYDALSPARQRSVRLGTSESPESTSTEPGQRGQGEGAGRGGRGNGTGGAEAPTGSWAEQAEQRIARRTGGITTTYTVGSVDAARGLTGIAERASQHYGVEVTPEQIYNLNRNTISDPNVIFAGQQLRMPESVQAAYQERLSEFAPRGTDPTGSENGQDRQYEEAWANWGW